MEEQETERMHSLAADAARSALQPITMYREIAEHVASLKLADPDELADLERRIDLAHAESVRVKNAISAILGRLDDGKEDLPWVI